MDLIEVIRDARGWTIWAIGQVELTLEDGGGGTLGFGGEAHDLEDLAELRALAAILNRADVRQRLGMARQSGPDDV
jgi:hypothetical protein